MGKPKNKRNKQKGCDPSGQLTADSSAASLGGANDVDSARQTTAAAKFIEKVPGMHQTNYWRIVLITSGLCTVHTPSVLPPHQRLPTAPPTGIASPQAQPPSTKTGHCSLH